MKKTDIRFCIVDDNIDFSNAFMHLLLPHGKIDQLTTPDQAIRYLRNNDPDIIFVDMDYNGKKEGPKIVKHAVEKGIYTIVLSSYRDQSLIEESLKLGAKDYFAKGDEVNIVDDILLEFQKLHSSSSLNTLPQNKNDNNEPELEFLFNNANSSVSILLTGETGTGKTYLAKKIHHLSKRKGKFVPINCSSIPRDLFEAEMFGYKEGAFTGSINSFQGRFVDADNGTIYLDEIDSMPLDQQAKLLKVIEDKQIYPIGSDRPISSNFRVIASSKKNLFPLIAEGIFREDLFYRISFLSHQLVPLRKQPNNILNYLNSFLDCSRQFALTEESRKIIQNYQWPGNLRELEIFAKRIKMNKTGLITKKTCKTFLDQQNFHSDFLTQNILGYAKQKGLNAAIQRLRHEIIRNTYTDNNFNMKKTLKDLKISSTAFYRWSPQVKTNLKRSKDVKQA